MKNLTLVILSVFLTINLSFAQEDSSEQSKTFEFGLSIGASYGDITTNSPDISSISDLHGYNAGILLKINLSDRFSLMPQAILHYRNNRLSRVDNDGNPTGSLIVNENTIEIPLHFVYHPLSKGFGNLGLIMGPRYINETSDRHHDLMNLKTQFNFDLGVSIDIPTKYFVTRPTLSYSRGLSNVQHYSGFEDPDAQKFNMNLDTYGFSLLFFGW